MLIINNVLSVDETLRFFQNADLNGKIEDVILSEQCMESVFLEHQDLNRQSFCRKNSLVKRIRRRLGRKRRLSRYSDGYPYSVGPMCAVNQCKTEWLLYMTEDTFLLDDGGHDWILQAMELIRDTEIFFTANPVWNLNVREAYEESEGKQGDFLISSGFSDQCFLIHIPKFFRQKGIYSETNEISEKLYPDYGGNTFEQRVNAYMRNHGLKRLTHIKSGYWSQTRKKEDVEKCIWIP